MAKFDISILITTYNRSKYLKYLLENIKDGVSDLDFNYEILISNNASNDDTCSVVDSFKKEFDFTYFVQESNIGAENNLNFLINKARGEYFIYLADDDLLDFELLNLAIEKIYSKSNVIALYSPWQIWDYKSKKSLALFYEAPEALIEKNNFKELGKFIINNKVFAEIGIFKTNVYKKMLPFYLENLFFAFKYPFEFITQGDIYFVNTPYYKTVVRYDIDPTTKLREQDGFLQTKTIYHKYRNSLFHIMRLMQLSQDDRKVLKQKIDEFMFQRLGVALDLSFRGREFIQSFELASIIIGEYGELTYRVKFEDIVEFAKLAYIKKMMDHNNIKKLVIVNSTDIDSNIQKFKGFFQNDKLEIYENEKFNEDVKCLYYLLNQPDEIAINNYKGVNSLLVHESVLKNKFI